MTITRALHGRPAWQRAMAVVLATVAILSAAALVMGISLVLFFMVSCEPPSITSLSAKFSKRLPDLQKIIAMSDQDRDFTRIAPTFVDQEGIDEGRYMLGDPKGRLPKQRWNAYREIYERNGIRLGIQRDPRSGDGFIMVDSVGLLNRGHATGYLFCGPGAKHAYAPCSSTSTSGGHAFTGHGDEGYYFIKLNDHWFAFDEGPS